MKLKLLAPFQTSFEIISEIPIKEPIKYEQFWERVAQNKDDLRIFLPHDLSLSSSLEEVRFPHRFRLNPSNRYRSLASDSLERTIHVLEIDFDDSTFLAAEQISVDDELMQKLLNNLNRLLCRVYDHGISLLELDIDLEDWLQQAAAAEITTELDALQQAGIDLGELLARWCNDQVLEPLFAWIFEAEQESGHFVAKTKKEGGGLVNGNVLWVTRTLIFEKGDEQNRNEIIAHWLKDSGGTERINGHTLIEEIINNENGHMTRWLNYLFREASYQSLEPQRIAPTNCARPFCDEWEAMLYAQYFYAALDVVDLHLTNILAHTLADEPEIKIERQKELLADNIRQTNLLLIQLHDSSKYYKRTVKTKLDDILDYWDFTEVLVNPVQRKITLCQERLQVLHQQEAAKSAIYTDMILLGIGVTAIFGTFIALAEYGRTMANDVNLASYDVNSPNFVDWFAAQPTDVILVVSSFLSLTLVVIYFYYRKTQVS